MKTKRLFPLAASVILLSGCATYGGWEPVTDSYNDPNAARIPQDTQECKMLASQAGSVGTEAAKGVAAGGLLGATPIRAATPRARRRGLLAALGVGAGITFVGALVFGTSRWDLGDKLQGTDAAGRGETWRTTPEQFWQAQGASLAGGALLGLGTGALLGAGLGMLVEHRPTKLKANLRIVPRALGLVVSGRF